MRSRLQLVSKRWLLNAFWPILVWGLSLTAIAAVVQLGGDVPTQLIFTNALITVILVVGLFVFVGNSGVLSFGHASFMAIGAYTAAIFTIPDAQRHLFLPDFAAAPVLGSLFLSQPVAIVAGGSVAALFAAILGFPLMRLSGIQAGIASLAVLIVVQIVAQNWQSVTGGLNSMVGFPLDTDLTAATAGAVIAIATASLYQHSRHGRMLRASREDEVAAAAIGVNVRFERRVALVVSAFVVGVGGALWGHFVGAFNPTSFYLTITFQTLAMLIIGGINTLSGAICGTLVVTVLTEGFHNLPADISLGGLSLAVPPNVPDIAIAVVVLLMLLLRPGGLTGGREVFIPSDFAAAANGARRTLGRIRGIGRSEPPRSNKGPN